MGCQFFKFEWLDEYERREERKEERQERERQERYEHELHRKSKDEDDQHDVYQKSEDDRSHYSISIERTDEKDELPICQRLKDEISTKRNTVHSQYEAKPITVTNEEKPSSANVNLHDEIEQMPTADPNAFNPHFIEQRQQAINNGSYRSTVKLWNPISLQQLANTIQSFAQGKSIIDRHWIIFYWIAHNIAYDTVSYFTKNYADQTAEGVFRNKRGVCAGYANLYKYLCDHLQLPCEVISGYAKGYGFDTGKGAPTETDHAWNAVQIDGHWYLLDSTWGAGHLNKQHSFEKKLNCFYFLTRPSHMIYDHLPEKDKWQLLQTPITMTQYLQMPKTHSTFFDLNLNIIHPHHQAHLTLVQNQSYASVHIRAPTDVSLIACLTNDEGQKIEGGEQVYFNEKKSIWQCKFAPNGTGSFVASIYAKKSSDVGSYSEAVSFQLKVNNLPLQPISFPKTEQIFYDLNLKIIAPKNSVNVPWPKNASYVEVLISAPDYVQLSCQMQYNENYMENGSLAQFDDKKRLWQLLFAPQNTGKHELIVFAKRTDQEESTFAVELHLYVTELRNKMEFPHIYGKFHTNQCRIYEPLNGILKKGAQVPIHCFIPGAIAVDVQIDSVWAKTKSYQDSIFKETITVGSKDVIIYARYNQGNSYNALAKYSVR